MNSRYCVLSRAIDAHRTDSREEPRDGERKQRCGARPGKGGPAATRYRNSLVAPFTDYSWRSVSRERRRASERLWATAAEGIELGKGASHGAPRRRRDCSLSSRSTRLGSTLLSGEKIRDSAQLRHAGPPLVGWLAGWVGLAHREPTGPPTATIHRNRAPSNPSDSHSPVYRLATSTVSARGVGRGKGYKEKTKDRESIRDFY